MRYTDIYSVLCWEIWFRCENIGIPFLSFQSLLLYLSTINTIVVITIIHFDFHNLFWSNCRIPGPIVSDRRHSLKNESEYNRGYSHAYGWARYVVVSKHYPLDNYHQNLLSYYSWRILLLILSLEQLGPEPQYHHPFHQDHRRFQPNINSNYWYS